MYANMKDYDQCIRANGSGLFMIANFACVPFHVSAGRSKGQTPFLYVQIIQCFFF